MTGNGVPACDGDPDLIQGNIPSRELLIWLAYNQKMSPKF
jgi:hypothetical protein